MSQNDQLLIAVLTSAHCSLKNFYATKNVQKAEQEIQEEVLEIYKHYADSDSVFREIKETLS